jgi:hypothetical protein
LPESTRDTFREGAAFPEKVTAALNLRPRKPLAVLNFQPDYLDQKDVERDAKKKNMSSFLVQSSSAERRSIAILSCWFSAII